MVEVVNESKDKRRIVDEKGDGNESSAKYKLQSSKLLRIGQEFVN